MKLSFGRINRKLETLVLLVVILPMSVLLLGCFFAWVTYLENRIRGAVEEQGTLTRNTLETEVSGYAHFLMGLKGDPEDLTGPIYREVSRHQLKAVAAVFVPRGLVFSSYPLPPSYWEGTDPEWGVFALLAAHPGELVCFNEKVTFLESIKSSFTLARSVPRAAGQPPFQAAFFLPLDQVVGSVTRSGVPVNLVITDQFDRVVYSDDPFFIDPLGKISVRNRASREPSDYLITRHELEQYNLRVYSMTSLSELHQMEGLGLLTMLGISLAGMAFFLVLSRVLVQRQMKPMESILRSLEEFSRGNFDVRLDVRSHDEFEILAGRFNDLLDLLNESISNRIFETNAAREAEIRQLEAQFNPHFLFNTIDSVSWMLRMDHNAIAIDTLANLASVLRYSIGRTRAIELSSLKQDLVYLKLYLRIMKTCLDGELAYSFEVNKEVLSLDLPKLLVQPLIENAIKHGKVAGRPLKIVVGFGTDPHEPERLLIRIEDNGRGFPQAQDHWFSGQDPLAVEGFGISSIVRRLRLTYGTDFRFHVQSVPGAGTTVRLYLPQRS